MKQRDNDMNETGTVFKVLGGKRQRQVAVAMVAVAMVVMSCGFGQRGCNTPPIPAWNMQEEAANWLGNVLMTDSGRALTGRQLATLHEERSNRDVALPYNEEDVLPRMATYRDAASGGTITFRPIEASVDTIHPIALAEVRMVTHDYQDSLSLPDSTEKQRVSYRGNGILAFYNIVHGGGPNGGKHRCYAKHPDGYPEYFAKLIYVYPGADSLLYSCGYKESHRVYKRINE